MDLALLPRVRNAFFVAKPPDFCTDLFLSRTVIIEVCQLGVLQNLNSFAKSSLSNLAKPPRQSTETAEKQTSNLQFVLKMTVQK